MTPVIRLAAIGLCLPLVSAVPSTAQIYDMREMATVDIERVDPARTVIIIPEGILEEHGPYLPSYTDGYRNEYLVRGVAESIVEREGWSVLIFPPIPLGDGGANQVAKRQVFAGTYHVHFSTLRAVFMDLASEFGEAGFRWVFAVSEHGAPRHQLALDQAGDFFGDVYGGTMVHLSGLIPDRPVRPGYRNAEPRPGADWRELVTRGAEAGWRGYYGAPGLATAARGSRIMEARLAELSELALRILDGFDARSLARLSDVQLEDEAIREYNAAADEHARRIQQVQQEWLRSRGRGE